MNTRLSRGSLLKGALASLAAATVLRGGARAAVPTPITEPAPMLTRPIPSSGEAMPVIGLGTYQVFDVGGNPAIRPALRQVLSRLLEAGGRMVDSSPMYGTAEAVTGELVADLKARPKTFLATKVWITGKERGVAQMKQSAERFRSEVIDLMQIHNLVDWQVHLATLRRMKEQGRIRYLGITHYTAGALDELAAIIAREPIDFVQLGYSIETREPEARVLKLCAERGVAVIVNQPFEQGALFRKVRGRALPDWAAGFDCTSWAQFFLKYLTGHPAITCVIPATDKPDHMTDDLAAGFGKQPDAKQRQQMAAFWDSL
jgi:diketogulonate reductase-like aldo/keto reductase